MARSSGVGSMPRMFQMSTVLPARLDLVQEGFEFRTSPRDFLALLPVHHALEQREPVRDCIAHGPQRFLVEALGPRQHLLVVEIVARMQLEPGERSEATLDFLLRQYARIVLE